MVVVLDLILYVMKWMIVWTSLTKTIVVGDNTVASLFLLSSIFVDQWGMICSLACEFVVLIFSNNSSCCALMVPV